MTRRTDIKWANHSLAAVVICAILLAATSLAAARTEKVKPDSTAAPPITISATEGGVRVAAPLTVVRVQLEILSESGEVLFDVVGKGSVLDWSLRDGAGQPVADGTYLCVVTVKTLSGGLSQRAGTVVVRGGRATVRGAESADLTEEQREQVGPLEEGAALSVLGADEDAPRATVVAHDGTALTSAGKAARADSGTQNRLAKWSETGTLTESAVTEVGGRVGIGTSTPAQALHVIGKGLFQTSGTASLVVMDRTDGKIAAVGAGGFSSTFAYDQSGVFKIESNSRDRIAAGVFGVANGATTRLLIDGAGNVAVTTPGQGLILKASNGTVCTRLTINNVGALNTDTVPCP